MKCIHQILLVLRLLPAIAAVLLVMGCEGKTDNEIQFLAGCKKSGAPEEACECIWGKVRESYSEEELTRMSVSRVIPPEFGEIMFNARNACDEFAQP